MIDVTIKEQETIKKGYRCSYIKNTLTPTLRIKMVRYVIKFLIEAIPFISYNV
ncbi:MAG: hypothetical protein RRZ64_05770 [Rikenellaceae bacterium]